jgi:hypothetical protein
MRRVALIVALLAVPAFAQETQAPQLDAFDKQTIAHVNQLAKLADTACTALDEMKVYESGRKLLETQIASRHPGFRLDPKGVLVPVK